MQRAAAGRETAAAPRNWEPHRWPWPGVSVIRHAPAPRTVGALAVPVVETALRAALMARPGGAPPTGSDRPRGTVPNSRRGRGRTLSRSRRARCTRGRFAGGGAAGPRRRSARGRLRLDNRAQPPARKLVTGPDATRLARSTRVPALFPAGAGVVFDGDPMSGTRRVEWRDHRSASTGCAAMQMFRTCACSWAGGRAGDVLPSARIPALLDWTCQERRRAPRRGTSFDPLFGDKERGHRDVFLGSVQFSVAIGTRLMPRGRGQLADRPEDTLAAGANHP